MTKRQLKAYVRRFTDPVLNWVNFHWYVIKETFFTQESDHGVHADKPEPKRAN